MGARAGTQAKRETAASLVSHPVRVQILTIANERAIGPARYVEEAMKIDSAERPDDWKRAVSAIAYHFRVLAKAGCLECVAETKRRGSIEHLYRGTERAHFTDQQWAAVPAEERSPITTLTWQGLIARTEAARIAGTIDARDDRWLAWTAARLDERGWEEMTSIMASASEGLEQMRQDAEARLEEAGEEGVPATYALMSFESPGTFFHDDAPLFTLPESPRSE